MDNENMTGKGTFKAFGIPDNSIIHFDGAIVNCHECGTTFSPVVFDAIATDKTKYHPITGLHSRLFLIIKGSRETKLCDCVETGWGEFGGLWMYDNPDPALCKKG